MAPITMNIVLLDRYQRAKQVQSGPATRGPRTEKIEHLQNLIEAGEYDTPRRLNAALDALLDSGDLD